jgi:hypothetical protein
MAFIPCLKFYLRARAYKENQNISLRDLCASVFPGFFTSGTWETPKSYRLRPVRGSHSGP